MCFFLFVGGFFNYIAKRCGFFTLSKPHLSPRIHYPIIGLVIYLIFFLFMVPVAIKFFYFVYSPLKIVFEHHPSLFIGATQVFSMMTTTCLVIIFSLFQEQGVVKTLWKENFTWISSLQDFGLGMTTWFMSFPLVIAMDKLGTFLTFFISHSSPKEQLAIQYVRLSTKSPFLLIIAITSTCLIAPLLEEWIFRGFIQTYLKSKIGCFKALICSSSIFAFFHISPSQGPENFTLVFSLFILALYLGFLYEKRKSLIAPIALHMTFNSISVMRIVLFSS